MDGFNKVISFVLGLVVVVVLIAIITGRLNLKQKLLSVSKGQTTTPTVIPTITPTRSANTTPGGSENTTKGGIPLTPAPNDTTRIIPKTGSETEVLGLALAL